MATLTAYPTGTPKADDLLLGTKVPLVNTDDSPITNNFTISSVAAFANSYSLGYTVYTALLTQAGTAAPVATVLQNTTGGTITWTRSGAEGRYLATISGGVTYTANKTSVLVTSGGADAAILRPVIISTTAIDWYNIDTGDSSATDVISATTTVEIRIYS